MLIAISRIKVREIISLCFDFFMLLLVSYFNIDLQCGVKS